MLIILICLMLVIAGCILFIFFKQRRKNNFSASNSAIMEEDKTDQLVSEALSLASPVEKENSIENNIGSFVSSNLAQEINNSYQKQNKSNNK